MAFFSERNELHFMITKELQEQALSLNPIDKICLVEMLLESLNKPEIDAAWVADSDRRYAAYKRGKLRDQRCTR